VEWEVIQVFERGLLNLANWTGNVIMPTVAGLFLAAAIYRFSKGQAYSHLGWAGFLSLMCSGLLRALEGFAAQAGVNDPDRFWLSILTLVDWTGNVMLPLYGALQVAVLAAHLGGVLERINIGVAWVRNLVAALMCFGLSGILRLLEHWIETAKAVR
jgi:hypothetical protein